MEVLFEGRLIDDGRDEWGSVEIGMPVKVAGYVAP